MSEQVPQNRSITRRSVARAPTTFQIFEDPPPPPPITIHFPNLPNVRFELVSPIRELPLINSAPNPRALQPNRWYTEPAGTGTWSLGPSRQMHQDYDVRSWHRVSPSISRSGSLVTTDDGESMTTDEGEPQTTDGGEGQTISSMVEEAIQMNNEDAVQASEKTSMSEPADSQGSDQPGKKERNRDRIRRFGMSIVKRLGKFRNDKRDREDRRPRGSRLLRAFSIFGFGSAARRGGQ